MAYELLCKMKFWTFQYLLLSTSIIFTSIILADQFRETWLHMAETKSFASS